MSKIAKTVGVGIPTTHSLRLWKRLKKKILQRRCCRSSRQYLHGTMRGNGRRMKMRRGRGEMMRIRHSWMLQRGVRLTHLIDRSQWITMNADRDV
jgi:hypothetical protein